MKTQTLQKIKGYAYDKFSCYKGCQHGLDHALRVVNNAKRMVKILKVEKRIDVNLLYASCWLHDIAVIDKNNNVISSLYFHFFESSINKKHIRRVLERFPLSKSEFQTIVNAIINHPHSIPYRSLNRNGDIYLKILQDADSFDYISDERLKSFNSNRWYLTPISNLYICLVKKNIKYFLNYPELAKYIDQF